jgi:signal transduction histidine kinase
VDVLVELVKIEGGDGGDSPGIGERIFSDKIASGLLFQAVFLTPSPMPNPDESKHSPDTPLACLYRIGNLVNNTDDPREALDLILDEIVRVLGASSAAISLLNPDTGGLRIEVSRGHERDSIGFELPLGRGITGWVALHARPLLVPDVRRDTRYFEIKPGIRSELAVPMEMAGGIIGVVNCDSDQLDAFSEDDLAFLSLLTGETAKVVGRLWLMRQLKSKAAQLETLVLAAQSLVHERDLPRVLSDLAAHTRQLADCRATAVYGVEDELLYLRCVDGNLGATQLAPVISLKDTSLGVVVSRARQVEVITAGRSEESLFAKLNKEISASSLLATPILFDNEVLGVLMVITNGIHRFNNDEKRLLATLASIGASAVQNARLYARVFSNEEDLRRSERLTTLGMLAAEIAHEVRNPLTVIKLLFDTLDLHFEPDDVRGEDIRVIREKLAHLETVVDRVLDYGKLQTRTFAPTELTAAIAETLQMMRLKFEQSHVQVEFSREDCPPEGCWIEGDKGQVQQVLLNLLLNAIHAMPEGGKIAVRLWREVKAGDMRACLQIADTGGGIPEELRSRVFESFLTGSNGGTGLGLAIVKRIMRSHYGDIALESSGPSGTTFSLWFSALKQEARFKT